MKIKQFVSFITTQTIMVCLLTFNPVVTHFGVAEASSEVYSAGAKQGLMRMLDLQGAIRGFGAQNTFAQLGPRVAEEGQKFIAQLKGKDRELLNTPEGVRFLKDHSRLSRIEALKDKFGKCVSNKENKRNLDTQIVNALQQAEYKGGCDRLLTKSQNGVVINTTLKQFITDMGKVQKDMNTDYSFNARKGHNLGKLQDELHMQSLKNSMASYMANRYKYEPGFINPETGKISTTHKNAVVNSMCKNEKNGTYCTSSQKRDLRKFVDEKAIEIAATQKKSDYYSARRAIRGSLKKLNQKLDKVDIKVDDGWVDSADLTNPATRGAWSDYQKTYIEELQTQDGLLMMTESMKEKAGGFRTLEDGYENKGSWINERYEMKRHNPNGFTINDLKKAKEEIDKKAIAQAKQLNSMGTDKRAQHKNWRATGYALTEDWGDWDKPEIIEQRQEDIQKLVKTNPAAVGQILVNNPEYADMICDAINAIDKQDKSDEKWDSVFMIGGLVVAGVMIVGGAACIVLSFGLCGPIGGATIAGGVTVGSAAMATVLVVGGVEAAYWGKRMYDHHTEYQNLERAILTNNMGEERIGDVERAYSAFKDARFNFLMALPAVVLPGVGKLASLSKGSKFANMVGKMGGATKARFLNNMTAFYEFLGKYPKFQKMVDALITTGKMPASKIHDFFTTLAQGKKNINAKFLGWLSKKLDDIDPNDATALQKFGLKFQGIVEEGLEAATKACKI